MSSDPQTITLANLPELDGDFKPLYDSTDKAAGGSMAESPMRTSPDMPPDEKAEYNRGYADAQRQAEEKFAAERAQYQALISGLDALQPEASDELAILIGETIETLVRQIVDDFIPDAHWLKGRIEKAASMIADCDAARTVWMHPDDIALIDDGAIALPLMPDSNAARGSVRIDCSSGWIESGTALYLEELRSELGHKGAAT